ncbi:MAG: cupin domain-containing protein [Candidatus Moranbacteria bacterium]|nr:cupin domain-containing protein [Candidatus Moranbacteria bacterium]
MKIFSQEEAKFFDSPEGRKAWIFGFPEYEFQYDEQQPKTILKWHHHAKIWETIYIIEGELVARWKENGEEKEHIVKTGDVIEPEFGSHTFENRSDGVVKFIAVKFVLSGEDKKKMIEKDKVYDE